MNKLKITVMKKVCHEDLIAKYENPIEHACDLQVGQSWILNEYKKPVEKAVHTAEKMLERQVRRAVTSDPIANEIRNALPKRPYCLTLIILTNSASVETIERLSRATYTKQYDMYPIKNRM